MDNVREMFAATAMAFGLALACVGAAWKLVDSLAWALVLGGVVTLVLGALATEIKAPAKR